jgi:hypothetical protein
MERVISARTKDLIKKAFKSIIDDPASWSQGAFVKETACETTYCLAGWMMIHDGHSYNDVQGWMRNGFKVYVADFIGPVINEIYGFPHWEDNGVYGTIFSAEDVTIDQLHGAIENLGIDLSEFAEQDGDANGDGDASKASFDVRCDNAIKDFVAECAAAGDRMTERQVRGDVILMSLLKKIRDIGIEEGWDKASSTNASVLEAQHLLKIEQRHVERLRGDLETQRSTTVEYIRQRDDALATLRAEIRELKDKVALSPGRRLEAVQEALKERTRQARQAGQSARIAEAKLGNALQRVMDLEAELVSVRHGTAELLSRKRTDTINQLNAALNQATIQFLQREQ